MKEKFSVIILSFLRPQNIHRICESILQLEEVEKLIVSNNNPDVNLAEYVNIIDERFAIINQKEKSGAFKRYEIARDINAQLFFSIDDDLFLNKAQMKYLMNKLLENPSAPHGFWGQNYVESQEHVSFEYGIINKNGNVDVLNRAYFFTNDHVQEIFNLLQKTKTTAIEVESCDDIFLSFSGKEKPVTHDIKTFVDCPTSNQEGIALWKSVDFDNKRIDMLKKILKVKNFQA